LEGDIYGEIVVGAIGGAGDPPCTPAFALPPSDWPENRFWPIKQRDFKRFWNWLPADLLPDSLRGTRETCFLETLR